MNSFLRRFHLSALASSLVLRPNCFYSTIPTGAAFAFSPSLPSLNNSSSAFTSKTFTSLFSSKSGDGSKEMSDEVAKAKEAAKTFKLSDVDGAGPATIFDKLLSGEWPSEKIYEDDMAFAFRDVAPQAPTHILVIPKNRDGLVSLSKAREDQKALLGHLMYVAQEIGTKECPKGFRIVINDGVEGAQSVFHLHLHILGGRQMKWPPG